MRELERVPSRARTAVVAVLGAAALAGATGTLFHRVRPPGARYLEARRSEMVAAASEALRRDAGRMASVASELQVSRDFASVVDGGGAEIRPSRLFRILSRTLPDGEGWGAVYLDASGKAVAWAGETGGPEARPAAEVGSWSSTFQVTRFSIIHSMARLAGRERRGTLLVSRSYPTGILRPDLIEYLSLGGGPTRLRMRATAPSAAGSLAALRFEPPEALVELEDGSRARARPYAVLAALALLGLAATGKLPRVAILGARLVVAAGSPLAERGIWMPLLPSGGEWLPLLGTPADLFLTGLTAVLLLRTAASRKDAWQPAGSFSRLVFRVLGAAMAAAAFLLVRHLASAGLMPGGGLNLLPGGAVPFLVRTGVVALASGLIGGAAVAFALGRVRLAPFVPAVAATLLLAAAAFGAGRPEAAVLGSGAAAGFALALGARLSRRGGDDPLSGLSGALFVLFAAAGVAGAALADGRYHHLDSLLRKAEVRAGSPGEREMEELPARWEGRLSRPSLLPWLPAGDRTGTTDLARALWVRGADKDYPRADDLLTVRDSDGRVASSFGLIRPGIEHRATSVLTELPLEGFAGVFTRLDSPSEGDRDPVLSALVEEDSGPRLTIERIDYDAAGRPSGPGSDPPEVPPGLLAEARKKGEASGTLDRGETALRVHLRSAGPGFVAVLVPVEEALVVVGTAVAAAEGALPLLLPLLIPSRRGRRGYVRPRDLLRRFRPATFRGRLVVLLLLSSALPLTGSVLAIRAALERHSAEETKRRSVNLLTEARRALESSEEDTPSEYELNRAAAVLGTDLLLYRDGRLLAASRALPVAAGLAGERLRSPVAEMLAEGHGEASAPAGVPGGRLRAVEAAVPLGRNPREAIAVVVVEDAAARAAVDGLVLFAVAAALAAFGLGGRAALTLSRPIEEVTRASRRIGSGEVAGPIERPHAADLAELVDAFEGMAAQVRERTALLARERAVAIELLSNLTAAVLLFRDRDGEVVLANPKAEELLPGGSLSERLAGETWAPMRELLDRDWQHRTPVETRMAIRQPDGERVFRVVVAPLPPDGSEKRSALLLEDLTGFVRAERLTAWIEAAKAIAHDIKNPLTPIRLSAERLLRSPHAEEPSRTQEAAATILRQVGILTERIGRLGRFSDPAQHPRALDGSRVVRLLREIQSDFSGNPAIRVEMDVPETLPVVAVDGESLRDALSNLVVNSVEAIGSRGGTVHLSATVEETGTGRVVVITCSDDGPGVGQDDLDRIFEPSFSTKSRGSGMGLAAARRTIESAGGSVAASLNPGGGLSIAFRLLSSH